MGPATSTTEASCSATAVELKPNGHGIPLRLTDAKDVHMDAYVGRWVEIKGTLRKPKDGDDMRQMHVDAYRVVPVVPPRVARVMPYVPPPPAAQPEPAPEPAPAATTGVVEVLPTTASPLPLIAFIGLLAFAAGFVLRQFRLGRG